MRHSAGVSAHNLKQNQFLTRDTLGFSFVMKLVTSMSGGGGGGPVCWGRGGGGYQ